LFFARINHISPLCVAAEGFSYSHIGYAELLPFSHKMGIRTCFFGVLDSIILPSEAAQSRVIPKNTAGEAALVTGRVINKNINNFRTLQT
jgi:hypothetical protein